MQVLKGVGVSPGVGVGEVFVLDDQRRRIPRRTVQPAQALAERARLEQALQLSLRELAALRQRTHIELGDDAAKIFAFHIGMLSDPSLTGPMHDAIDRDLVTAEYAVWAGLQSLADRFSQMGDPAFRTKVDDVHDLSMRVLKNLIGEHAGRLADMKHRAVVFARDLTPSQAAAFNKNNVLAFVTEAGGRTGHTGIFARALRIPAVVACQRATEVVSDGTPVIVDGDSGTVIISPDERTLARYRTLQDRRALFRISLSELARLEPVTADGHRVELHGNIEFPDEIPHVLEAGGTGVGLYRTEFLYLASNSEPTEEDHYEACRRCVDLLAGRPLTIRTVDLGADKYTQQRADDPEPNPMLGLRSIRYCLANPDMFRRQLRAILRASAHGPVRVMFPLVTSPEEFRRARFVLNEVMEDLRDRRVRFDQNVPVGMMVEVPSAAILARQFAQDADFFSIGTNDLVQYALAVDRTNQAVAHMFNPAHPAVLDLIRATVAGAASRPIPVSCCGESAGDVEQAMLLIGLGLRTLSAAPASLPALKRLVRSVTVHQCEEVVRKVATLDSDAAVSRYLLTVTRNIIPEAFAGSSGDD